MGSPSNQVFAKRTCRRLPQERPRCPSGFFCIELKVLNRYELITYGAFSSTTAWSTGLVSAKRIATTRFRSPPSDENVHKRRGRLTTGLQDSILPYRPRETESWRRLLKIRTHLRRTEAHGSRL